MPENISTVVRWITCVDPKSVLDVGIGFGKYGVLAREYTDIRHGRYRKEGWKTQIDGIEIFELYRNLVWQVYDKIYIGDALTLIDSLVNYELILLGDVIEHFAKVDGMTLLTKCQQHSTKAVIVSTPFGNYPQDAVFGNEHEWHLSMWLPEDFSDGKWERQIDGGCITAIYRKDYHGKE